MIIAIDGPAASGKSSTASAVAKEMNILHIDTGSMYRAVTLGLIRNGISFLNKKKIKSFLNDLAIDFIYGLHPTKIIFSGTDVTDEIRSPIVTRNVSEVSAIKIVRDKMVSLQRRVALNQDCILDGRDIGTIVFPTADFKFYLEASIEIRASRRIKEFNKHNEYNISEMVKEIAIRDEFDSTRENSPLIKAEDAILIDTSLITFEEQINKIINIINKNKEH